MKTDVEALRAYEVYDLKVTDEMENNSFCLKGTLET